MYWDELEFFSSNKFKKIVRFLKEERESGKNILPPKEAILNALALTPLDEVKVVIIGQDPYPNKEHPIGLAFAVSERVNPLPKSLINIFRELKDDTGTDRTIGDLSDWARQGVLLLNTSLTVVEGKPGSHSGIGWSGLCKDTIRVLNEQRENIVFILWGKHAQKYEMFIDRNKHFVIKSPHPSPLSAHRGFFGSKPFSQTNKYLEEHNIKQIEW